MFYFLTTNHMGKETTANPGAEPGEKKDFETEVMEILNWMVDWNSQEDPKEDKKWEEEKPKEDEKTPGDDSKKSEDGEWKSKEEIPKEDEELKIPFSRLNKEIEKRKSIEDKFNKIQEKMDKEKERLNSLTDEEKEEQANLSKLGMDTRLSKLQDIIDDLKEDLSEKDEAIKEMKEEINGKQTKNLSIRIAELTKKHDWTDWLPKFDIKDLVEFGKKEEYMPSDPMKLYNMKYQAEIYAKKFEKSGTEIDKGNKWNFEPAKKKPTFKDWDEDFEAEAKRILDSVGLTK